MKPYLQHLLLSLTTALSLTILFSSCISITAAPEQKERRTRKQATIPEGYSELPFVETAPPPIATQEEKKRGFMLFTRPITEPVQANTHPLKNERLEGALSAFATPGEWEPITLSVYPLRDLKNFRLQVSDLTGPDGEKISSSQLTVRLQTYWNIGYPRYASRETYRRVPELLERINVHSSPAKECQRWWIQAHIPEQTKAGSYQGIVTVQDDQSGQAIKIPLNLKVLGFPLKSDPQKHYSAYYRPHDKVAYKDKDEAFYQKASANEFKAMRDYGIDQFPTLYLIANKEGTKISISNEEIIKPLMATGMKGLLPVLGGNAITRIYQATTPGGKRGSHWKVNIMPPPEFYQRLTKVFREFAEDCKKRGLPPMICCPLDEVAASHKEFGIKVFKAIHAAGIKTYITKFPTAPDALNYAPYVDVWCSQPYAIPYEEIVAQKRHGYWSYPNHNAGERKNRRVMCKGGRMTYGFGFWRSGYSTLIPWHWSWTMAPDTFDYLRSLQSGCGMRIDEAGEIIPAIYWECFREGRDDARYLYTLQQAIFEREGSKDAKCQKELAAAKKLLQENWDAIQVQQRYLADGMWPSEEFNARRWQLASMIEKLLNYPAINKGAAPSVLVGNTKLKSKANAESALEEAIKKGIVTSLDIAEGFSDWKNDTPEGKASITPDASQNGKSALRWQVDIDHQSGTENPDHWVGWPRIRRTFKDGTLDLSKYDFLEFMVRVDSDRDEVADDKTPFGISIRNYGKPGRLYEIRKDLGDQQRVWIPLRFPIKELIETTALGTEPWKNIHTIQLFIAEGDYLDKTSITFDISSAKLLASSKPLISSIEASKLLLLPNSTLPITFNVIGLNTVKKGSHSMSAALLDAKGETLSQHQQDLSTGEQVQLNTDKLLPGKYTLKTQITSTSGELCSENTQSVELIAGPFFKKKTEKSKKVLSADTIILEARFPAGITTPLTVSVPFDLADFRKPVNNSLGVQVIAGGKILPSQFDRKPKSSTGILTVLLFPQALQAKDGIQIIPINKTKAAEQWMENKVKIAEKNGVFTVSNQNFTVQHDPEKSGGLISSIQVRGGPLLNQYRNGDRLFRKEDKAESYFLMYDKNPQIEVLKQGPYEVQIQVTARYLDDKGKAPESNPRATYLFTYDRSPLVKIHTELKQDSPAFWKELHQVELGFSHQEFDHWMTSNEKLFSPLLLKGKAGKPQSLWSTLASTKGGLIGLRSTQKTSLYDGEGTINHYLHGFWGRWTETSKSTDLTLALLPSRKSAPSVELVTQISDLFDHQTPEAEAWLSSSTVEVFQKSKNLSPVNQHAAWLMDNRSDLFSSLKMKRQLAKDILEKSPDTAAIGNSFGIPGLTVIGDSKQSLAFQQTNEGIGVIGVLDAKSNQGFLSRELSPIWQADLLLPTQSGGFEDRPREISSLAAWKTVAIKKTITGLQLTWSDNQDLPDTDLKVTCIIELKNGRSEWNLEVTNQSQSLLKTVDFPLWTLASLSSKKSGDSFLLLPRSSGIAIKNPIKTGVGIGLLYPSGRSPMQCFAHYNKQAGLYLATHDAKGSKKHTRANSHPTQQSITLITEVPVPDNMTPGNDWKSPGPAILEVFTGDWFDASQIYKKWVQSKAAWWPHEDKKSPKWLRDIAAWSIISGPAKYVTPRMKDFAAYLEVPTALHWYNWHQHPFDNNYPEYFPAKPGTATGLKEMQQAGIRVTPYINGLIWDKTREDFKTQALPGSTKKEDGETYTMTFNSKIPFAPMCPTTPVWRNKVAEIINKLTGPDFGFDGVYLDQIAASAPTSCYDKSHKHTLGGGHWWHTQGYWPLLEKTRSIAVKNRPDAALTSEANSEVYVKHTDALLTWHFQYQDQVPLFASVYAGKIHMFGRAYQKDSWKGISMRAKTAQAFVFGEQLGWIPPAVIKDPVAGPYLKQLAQLRYKLLDFLADGEMLRPPHLIGKIPDANVIWPWYSGDSKITLKGVQTGAWKAQDGRIVLLFANILDEKISFNVDYRTDTTKKTLLKKTITLKAREAINIEIKAPH